MIRLEKLGISKKDITSYCSLVLLVKTKQHLCWVCTSFHYLNEKLVKINNAFLLIRDCIEAMIKAIVRSRIKQMRDAKYTLQLFFQSQKYCGVTLYYGSLLPQHLLLPQHYSLKLGMGLSISPAIWQQFIHSYKLIATLKIITNPL